MECAHCDKPAEWMFKQTPICQRCMATLDTYQNEKLSAFEPLGYCPTNRVTPHLRSECINPGKFSVDLRKVPVAPEGTGEQVTYKFSPKQWPCKDVTDWDGAGPTHCRHETCKPRG